jgi:hypothetical protein
MPLAESLTTAKTGLGADGVMLQYAALQNPHSCTYPRRR